MTKIFVFMFSIIAFIICINVKAEQLVMNYSGNPYYVISGNGNYHSSIVTYFDINGEVAYCVEPGILITDFNYYEESINTLPYNDNKINLIKLIGYYGYEYPNHQTKEFRMATQALIWETIKEESVEFYTEKNGGGNIVDVSNERNEIMRLVNNHYTLPEFGNDLILSINQDNILIDNNNVLANYEIINSNRNLEVYKEGNNLHIKTNEIGDYQITLRKIKYDNNTTRLFIASNGVSQKLMKLRFDDNVETTLNIHMVGGKLYLQKLDYETNTNKSLGNSTLLNAKYGIYDQSNNIIEELTTNEFGESVSSYLAYGTYYLKEITPSYGYELDLNKYEFIVNKDNLNINLNVYESLKKQNITIIKTLEGDYSILNGENDITFEIYFKNNNLLYQTITTDESGVTKIKLPYGEYIFHQVNTSEGYLTSDDFIIEVDENTEDVYKVILDKRVLGKIQIIKSDEDTGVRLANAFIEVYEDDDLIYSGYTNEEGYIALNNLYVGSYKIIEKEAPSGYIINDNEYLVDITNDKPDIIVEIKNKHEEVIVPNTSLNESSNLKISSIGIFFIGFLLILLSKKDILFNIKNNL
ncbi:MAG: Cys-Gln thioester bond-forming surface protein [Bacilli bacterium]|nr:Cys-Gln thioester bond-forming surface protein [Bacilli bacterium]